MLDVHPPHHPTHGWRDFFIHIATIVVGLLIAVGLEQSVETIHRHHQRQELVQALLEDTRKAIRDSEEYQRVTEANKAWVAQRIAEVRSAIFNHHPLTQPKVEYPAIPPNLPEAPSWTAATSSGLLAVLSQDEVRSFGEAAGLAVDFTPLARGEIEQANKTQRFDQRYIISSAPIRYDYAAGSPADLQQYLDLLLALQSQLHGLDLWLRYIRGADAAILEGSRNLDSIENSELRFLPAEPAR